jgi:type VI secretion system protein ImpJ
MNQSSEIALPDAVQWAEGMLLTPQHFQQNDIHWNSVLQHRLRGLSAHHWGVVEMEMDTGQLAVNSILVTKLSCVFPDGTAYDLSSTGIELKLDLLKDTNIMEAKRLFICAAIPPRTGAMNVQSTSIKRYEVISSNNAVIDEMTGYADVFVDRIRPTVKLYPENRRPDGYAYIRLFEITYSVQSKSIELTSFHPPMLRIGAADFGNRGASLLQLLKTLRDELWDKLRQLTGMPEKDGPESTAGMSEEECLQLRQARYIASALTVFDAVILDPETAPAEAYRAMAQVIGHMSWIGSNPAPLAMPPYNHEDCAPQFKSAVDFVWRKLALINPDWEGLPFTRVGELAFLRRLPDEIPESLLVEIRLREGQRLSDVHDWLSDSRIGSDDLMQMLRNQRLTGASWTLLDSKEIASLGLRSDAIVARIKNEKVEVEQHGLVDCFRPGRGLLIQSNNAQLVPAAVILQNPYKPNAPAPRKKGQ